MEYELTPVKKLKTVKAVGKDNKMSKNSTTQEAPKSARKYAKTRGEHYKDIVIAILVTAIIAFGLGVKIQSDRSAEVASAIKNAVVPAANAEGK